MTLPQTGEITRTDLNILAGTAKDVAKHPHLSPRVKHEFGQLCTRLISQHSRDEGRSVTDTLDDLRMGASEHYQTLMAATDLANTGNLHSTRQVAATVLKHGLPQESAQQVK